MSEKYHDKEVLESLYWDMGMSQGEIADRFGVAQSTISEWMSRHGIDSRLSDFEKPPSFDMDKRGYERWQHHDGVDQNEVFVHRVLAVAEHGLDAVKGKHVHHKNHIPWDNRHGNIDLLTVSEHAEYHSKTQDRTETGEFA